MRFRCVISPDIRFYHEQAERCRALARQTDELRRRLIEMAEECDGRSRAATDLVQRSQAKNRSPPHPNEAIEPLTLSIKDAGRLLGLGRSTIYRLIGDRQLETVKIGNRTLIKAASMRRLIEIQD